MDSIEMSLCELDLRFYFVTKDGEPDDELEDLNSCFERIAQRFDATDSYSWISEAECVQLAAAKPPLTRKSVFVFSTFDGEAFETLRTRTKAMLLGPRCIIDCFMNDTNIPNVPSPIFNVTLRNHTVCTSGLKPSDKADVHKLVQYMGGFLANDLSANTTYLVTNTTMSVKYEKAATAGIRTVTIGWVKALWDKSAGPNPTPFELTASTEEQLHDAHRIPLFYRLGITSTGIAVAQRNQLKTLIEEHGGVYHGSFKAEMISILAVTRSGTNSDKFRAAQKCRKFCLTPEWFTDSVARGFALPVEEYLVVSPEQQKQQEQQPTRSRSKALFGSTPTKRTSNTSNTSAVDAPNESKAFYGDCTNLSEILDNVTVNESRVSVAAASSSTRRSTAVDAAARAEQQAYKVVLANINVQQAKKSGSFLDGSNVYLCGFTGAEKEQLIKILTNASATRFDEYDSRVEYVIVGQPTDDELLLLDGLNGRSLVTPQWLVASIEAKQPVAVRDHLYSMPANRKPSPGGAATRPGQISAAPGVIASPASKKNMASMSHSFRKPQPRRRLEMDDELAQAQANAESDLLQQYMEAAAPQPPQQPQPPPTTEKSPSMTTSMAAENDQVEARQLQQQNAEALALQTATTLTGDEDTLQVAYYDGCTFFVDGFTAESEEDMVEQIELAGGQLVSSDFGRTVDYVIVPLDIFCPDDVLMAGRQMVNEHWVTDCAVAQARVDIQYYHRPFEWANEENTPLVGMTLVLSTYSGSERSYLTNIGRIMGADVQDRYIKTQSPVLITPRPEGAKYNGAIKWGLPVVNCEWLLMCASKARRVAMRPFLVGASVAPSNEPANVSPTDNADVDSGAKKQQRPLSNSKDVAQVSRTVDAAQLSMKQLVAPVLPEKSTDSLQITAVATPPSKNTTMSASATKMARPPLVGPVLNEKSTDSLQITGMDTPPRASTSTTPTTSANVSTNVSMLPLVGPVLNQKSTDSLQISGMDTPTNKSLVAAQSPAAAAVVSPMQPPSSTKTIPNNVSSVERLKRMRPIDSGPPSSAEQTPVLKHRRLSQIVNPSRRDSPIYVGGGGGGASQTPSKSDFESNLRSDLAEMPTPSRELVVREVMQIMDAETPETKRRNDAISTPNLMRSAMPAECRTPAFEAQLRAVRNMHDLGTPPVPVPITPMAEVQRRFWKKSLGDEYVSPSQRMATQTQHQLAQPTNVHHDISNDISAGTQPDFSAAAPAASSTQMTAAPAAADPATSAGDALRAANSHVKRLSDFILNQKAGTDKTPSKKADCLAGPSAAIATQTQQPLTATAAAVGGASEATDAVGWRDPADFYDEHRFRGRNQMQHQGTPRFNISCTDAVRLERIREQIVRLGGELCENRGGYDPTCTHVLCERPSRSEKIFSAIAAGKWLLSLGYIQDSALAQSFLNEEAYEFGNPLATDTVGPDGVVDETSRAAHRWRKHLQALREKQADGSSTAARPIGVFSAFRVILHTSKKAAFKSLLEAGAGSVLDVTEPYETSKEALTATHCIQDSRHKLSARDRQALQRAGVACVNISFLQAFVSSDTEPNPKDFAV